MTSRHRSRRAVAPVLTLCVSLGYTMKLTGFRTGLKGVRRVRMYRQVNDLDRFEAGLVHHGPLEGRGDFSTKGNRRAGEPSDAPFELCGETDRRPDD